MLTPRRPSALEQVATYLAALLCLLAMAQLRDVPLRSHNPDSAAKAAPQRRDATLQLTVMDRGGKAAAGANVHVFSMQRNNAFQAASGTTGKDGKLTLKQLPRGETWVVARGKGLARTSTRLLLQGGERRIELKLHSGEHFEVVVVDPMQRPIRDVHVTMHGGDPLPHVAATDIRGLARIDGLGPAPYTAEIRARGFDRKVVTDLQLTDSPLFIKLDRLGRIEGTATAKGDHTYWING